MNIFILKPILSPMFRCLLLGTRVGVVDKSRDFAGGVSDGVKSGRAGVSVNLVSCDDGKCYPYGYWFCG